MQSIRGIYNGKEIKPLEAINVRPNVHVIITFLDDVLDDGKQTQTITPEQIGHGETSTQRFLKKCGGWEDTRNTEEIIAEIYTLRTTSERGSQLFQEDAS